MENENRDIIDSLAKNPMKLIFASILTMLIIWGATWFICIILPEITQESKHDQDVRQFVTIIEQTHHINLH